MTANPTLHEPCSADQARCPERFHHCRRRPPLPPRSSHRRKPTSAQTTAARRRSADRSSSRSTLARSAGEAGRCGCASTPQSTATGKRRCNACCSTRSCATWTWPGGFSTRTSKPTESICRSSGGEEAGALNFAMRYAVMRKRIQVYTDQAPKRGLKLAAATNERAPEWNLIADLQAHEQTHAGCPSRPDTS